MPPSATQPAPLKITLLVETDLESKWVSLSRPIAYSVKEIEAEEFEKYLAEAGLVRSLEGRPQALPQLRRVWYQVEELSASAMEPTLTQRAGEFDSRQTTDITLLGISVSTKLAVIAGPVALISLMIYLLAHAYHIEAIRPEHDAELRKFPWMGVFTSELGEWLTYGSVLFLPTASVLCVVLRSKLTWHWTLLCASVYTLALVWVGALVARAVARLNHPPINVSGRTRETGVCFRRLRRAGTDSETGQVNMRTPASPPGEPHPLSRPRRRNG